MMNNFNVRTLVTVIALTVLAACNNAAKTNESQVALQQTEEETATIETVSLKDDELNPIYQQYLSLNNALIGSDVMMVKEAAMLIEFGADAIGNKKIAYLAGKISTSSDLEVQRTLFSDLSNEMIEKIKVAGVKSGEIYVEHCPMALNDKGAFWLSNQKEIKNPYFGASMLDCGSVKETLN
jgi:hypothetical protein